MSMIKRWFEEHIDDFSDEELSDMGYSNEDIEMLRECLSKKKEEESQ